MKKQKLWLLAFLALVVGGCKQVYLVDALPGSTVEQPLADSLAIKVISCTVLTGGDSWQVLLAAHKSRLEQYSGNQYFYVGDMTNWQNVVLSPADTNYETGGRSGYLAVKVICPNGLSKLGIGKIVGDKPVWGIFKGDQTMLSLKVDGSAGTASLQ